MAHSATPHPVRKIRMCQGDTIAKQQMAARVLSVSRTHCADYDGGIPNRRTPLRILAILPLLLLSATGALAAESVPPLGMWKTIDDATGQQRGLVELYMEGDELKGRILDTFPAAGEPADPVCLKCGGARKDQPVKGMTFLWGLTRDGDQWRGGEILDPANGEIYDAKLKVIDDGGKLEVRGFLGLSLLGRTQTWLREPQRF